MNLQHSIDYINLLRGIRESRLKIKNYNKIRFSNPKNMKKWKKVEIEKSELNNTSCIFFLKDKKYQALVIFIRGKELHIWLHSINSDPIQLKKIELLRK